MPTISTPEQFRRPTAAPAATGGRKAYRPAASDASPASSSRWYALRTRSRFEWRVRNALRESGIEEFLPSYVEVVRWTDRVKNTPRVLFPSYLFARFARTTEGAAVLSITGVVQILGRDESDSISAGEIANLRRAASLSVSPCPYAAAGEIVTITSGPLTGMSGVVVRTDAALRLVISVEMFGKACSVRIDAADVEKATAS